MKSIKETVKTNIVINKSEFINYLAPVRSVEEANQFLDSLRVTHKDANHHCYAYIIGDHQEIQKYSDDGEPSKTAGLPMIEVLKKHDLTDVIIVCVRYFGGIKLGAGGLVRAYTKGCASCVKEMSPSYKESFTTLKVSIPFDLIGVCEHFIREHYILEDTLYDSLVHYIITVSSNALSVLKSSLTEKTSGRATFEQLNIIEKYV